MTIYEYILGTLRRHAMQNVGGLVPELLMRGAIRSLRRQASSAR